MIQILKNYPAHMCAFQNLSTFTITKTSTVFASFSTMASLTRQLNAQKHYFYPTVRGLNLQNKINGKIEDIDLKLHLLFSR